MSFFSSFLRSFALANRVFFALGVVVIAGLIGSGMTPAWAQQPEQKTVFDHLEENGQIGELPPPVLRERGRRNPASLSTEQRRRLRKYQTRDGATPGARAKAQRNRFDFKDPVQSNGAVAWSRSDLNFRPRRSAQRAGDVNGDGVNDWIYVYTPGIADDRTAALSDRTPKTVLKFGGSGEFSSAYFDELYYRNLQPVGNFVGDAKADAIDIRRNSYRILEGTSSGYAEVFARPALPSRVTAARMAPVDLDADGFDDAVFPNPQESTITVLYGAQNPGEVERETYSPPSVDGSSVFSYATGNVDGDSIGGISNAEIVRVAGATDTTGTDSLTVDILDVDGARTLSTDTTFNTAPLADIKSALTGDENTSVTAFDLTTEVANVDGADLQEIILQDANNTWAALYTSGAAGTLYDNTARAVPAGILDVGDLNGDGRADFFLPSDTSIAFGPSSASDGLTADASVSGSSSETVRLFDYADTQIGNRLGDVNGDGDDEFIASFSGTSQFGARLVDVSSGAASTTDFAFDESEYGRRGVVTTRNIGDWNGDGTDDVALALGDGRVELYFGDPTTGLAPDLTLTEQDTRSFFTASLATGDFTGNGQPNLAVGWRSASRTVAVYEAGEGSTPVQTVGVSDLGISTTAPSLENGLLTSVVGNVGDVNADGTDDLVVTVPSVETAAAQAAFLFLGQSSLSGSPDVTINYSDDGASRSVGSTTEALGDINDDGVEDFAIADIERSLSTDQGFAQGGIYVHYGQDAEPPSFGAPDEIITPKPDPEEVVNFFPLGMTSGDFNGDGTPDLAAKPAFFQTFNGEPTEAIRIYEGGAFFGRTPDQEFFLPGFLAPNTQIEFATGNVGELTTLPPEAGSNTDRLMVGTSSPANALVFSPTEVRSGIIESGTLLRAPDQNDGLGTNNNNFFSNGEASAVGDVNGDDRLETILPQPQNPNFLGSPAYTYQLGAAGGDVAAAQPVAAETRRLDAGRIETGTGTASFRTPRVKLVLSAQGNGEGDVTVGRYAGQPFEAGTVDQENVSSYYVRIGVEKDSTDTDDVIGDSSRVRFDVSGLPGLSTPRSVTVYQRELPDAGAFTALPTSYDSGTNELVVRGVSKPGEFVLASNVDPLTPVVGVPPRLSATTGSDSVSVEWDGIASADQYFVYRSTSPIDWAAGPSGTTPFDTTAAGTTSLTDTSAQVGEAYYYRVTAVNGEGVESSFSPQSQARRTVVVGSPSGDEAVTAGDASLVRQFSVGLTDFDQAQRLAGDVSGDETVNAADASLIQQFIVGLIDTFPADTAKAQPAPLAEVSGTVAWGEPTGATDGRTRIPLQLTDEPKNVRSVQLAVTYDTSAVTISDVKTDRLPRGWRALHNVDAASGTVRIALSGTEPADAGRVATLVLDGSGGGSSELSGQTTLYTSKEQSLGTVSVGGVPEAFRVEENYPNPVREKTTIEYALPEQTTVEIAVYDLLGRRVRTLVEGKKDEGEHTVTVDASTLASGTYFYRVRTDEATETGRMVVVR